MKPQAGGGCVVIPGSSEYRIEGARRFRIPLSKEIGTRDIVQTVSLYDRGRVPSRRSPYAEEVLYVVRGFGVCRIDDFAYALRPGTAVCIPPGSIYQIQNTQEDPLEIVGVACPEDRIVQIDLPLQAPSRSTPPKRTLVEQAEESVPSAERNQSPPSRSFKVLVGREQGCRRVIQFVGVIPPGSAPMHHHPYEEAIYILEGEGRVRTEQGDAGFASGTSIYLPRGASHCLENNGSANVRILGVFHPAEAPATQYEN